MCGAAGPVGRTAVRGGWFESYDSPNGRAQLRSVSDLTPEQVDEYVTRLKDGDDGPVRTFVPDPGPLRGDGDGQLARRVVRGPARSRTGWGGRALGSDLPSLGWLWLWLTGG